MFSGEEVYGKYLDVYANHTTYNNMKNIGKRIGYLQYLDALLLAENGLIHMDIPKETRLSRDYETCVNQMFLSPFAQYVLGTSSRYTPISHPSCAGRNHWSTSIRNKPLQLRSSTKSGKRVNSRVGRM